MSALDSRIDELYQTRPEQFVSSRTALAKTLTGTEARRVKALAKPTTVAWTVNQVYWHARDVYDRLRKAGQAVRASQLGALKGRVADVRGATEAHRGAIGEAVKVAEHLASTLGGRPDAEALAALFEAVSLREHLSEAHGRLTRSLPPQGFEALAGVPIKPSIRAPASSPVGARSNPKPLLVSSRAARSHETRRREREEAAAERRRQAAIKKGEAVIAHARAAEARARAVWNRSKQQLEDAERALRVVRQQAPE